MDNGSGDSQEQTTLHLNVANRQQLRQFLKAIQPQFLRVVNPRESGLLDILYAAELLTDTDHESMSGKDVHTRKDQARKLWFLLNKMPVREFLSKVSPALLKEFPHIIPKRFLSLEAVDATTCDDGDQQYCLRHDIMGKIRVTAMTDLLYHHDHLEFEDYEAMTSDDMKTDRMWMKVFHACQDGGQKGSQSQLVRGLQALLHKYQLVVPENLERLVSRGIACTCNHGSLLLPDSASPSPLRKAGSWVKKSSFDRVSPLQSPWSSCSRLDVRSYSGATSPRDDDSQSLASENSLDPDSMAISPIPPDDSNDLKRNMSMIQEEDEDLFPVSATAPLLYKSLNNAAEETQPMITRIGKEEKSYAANYWDHEPTASSSYKMEDADDDQASVDSADEMTYVKTETPELAQKPHVLESVYIPSLESGLGSGDTTRKHTASGTSFESLTAEEKELIEYGAKIIEAAVAYFRSQICNSLCFGVYMVFIMCIFGGLCLLFFLSQQLLFF